MNARPTLRTLPALAVILIGTVCPCSLQSMEADAETAGHAQHRQESPTPSAPQDPECRHVSCLNDCDLADALPPKPEAAPEDAGQADADAALAAIGLAAPPTIAAFAHLASPEPPARATDTPVSRFDELLN